MRSSLIKLPEFKELPKTQLANVPENIENWIAKEKWHMLEQFCRPSGNGYRFVDTRDLGDVKVIAQKILGRYVTCIFRRIIWTTDSFCPLYFTEKKVLVTIKYKGKLHEFVNDNQLRNFLKQTDNEENL